MFYSVLLFIFLFLEIIFASFLLSQYVCSRNNFFESNFFGRWMIGLSVYLGLSIIIFFPFAFFISTINIIYLIVIFFLKDFFVYLFLFLRRNTYLKFDKEYLYFGLTIIVTLLIWLIYFFVFTSFITTKPYIDENIFNFLNMFERVLTEMFFDIEKLFTKIFLQFITIFVIYSVVMTFIYEISSRQSWEEHFVGLLCSLVSIILFNFQKEVQFNIFIYIILFSLILAIRFILFSRRRYAIIFGLSTIIAYSLDKNAIIPLSSLAVTTLVIYTFLNKPKISLFWIVLIIPITLVISLDLYRISIILSMIIVGVLIYSYIFVLNTGRNITFSKIDNFVVRYKTLIPIFILGFVFLFSFLNWFNGNYEISKMDTIFKPILGFSNSTNEVLRWIEFAFYLFVSIAVISWTLFSWISKKRRISRIYLMMLFLSFILISIYNPLSNIAFQTNAFIESFNVLKTIIFIPLTIISINFIKEKIKSFIAVQKSPTRKNIKTYYS